MPPGGSSLPFIFSTKLHSGHSVHRVGVINATASSNEPEPDILLANNVIKVYSYSHPNHAHMKGNKLALLLSVDNLRPKAGNDGVIAVDFDLTARNVNATALIGSFFVNLIADARVKVELSKGLKFHKDWQPPATLFMKSDSQSGTWSPPDTDRKGTTAPPNERKIEIETQLTSESLDDIPLEERCITAWVEDSKPPPSPGYALGSLKQCLGDDPPVLFESGKVELMAVYSCFGANPVAYPCRSDSQGAVVNDLELLVRANPLENLDIRSRGIGRIDEDEGSTFGGYRAALRPEQVVIQVKDPEGRRSDSSGVRWQTYSDAFTRGVDLDEKFINKGTATWTASRVRDKVTAVGLNGNKPGTLSIKDSVDDTEYANADWDFPTDSTVWYSFSDLLRVYYEMSTLGTYVTTRSFRAERSGLTTPYTASGTFHIHVGPIAELEVRDGGASVHAAADESALTIVALNNGPDTAPAKVTGLPTGAKALHTSQGSYDPDTGVWDIGELEDKDLLRASGRPQATLDLGASDGDTASVSIANSKNYEVCIDSSGEDVDLSSPSETACTTEDSTNSWHTTAYYDHIAGNNTAAITAARGTGGVGPGIPANPRTQTGTTAVMWDEVGLLHGVPVSHYQVQWLGNGWTTLDRAVYGTQYGDAAPSGRRDYRVRAVNLAGAAGPWSRSTATAQAGQAGPPVNLRAQADGNNAIDLFWDAPEDAGGSAVTGYTVQWSSDGTEGSWRNAGNATDLTFKHRGLEVGAIRHYRVAARNSGGLGHWSVPVMGQTVSGVPDAPTLTAKTLSDYEIELTWNEPKDNGEAISGYQVEWSPDGSAESWSRLTDAGVDPTSYTDSTLPANTRRHYRVRAVNSVGNGAWSRTVSAITQLTPPDAPSLTSLEADGPNAIVVSWSEPYNLGDLSITQYQVQYAKDPDSKIWRGPATLSGSTLSWRHTGLKPGETWHYQVRASNGGGRWSPWSYYLSATTASDDAPKPVTGFSVGYNKESGRVELTWNDLARNSGEATFDYELERSEDGSDWRLLATVRSNDSSRCTEADGKCKYEDGDLWPGAKLYYRVRAGSVQDKGPWAAQKTATVPANPPDEPWISWSEADGSNHIYLEWEPPYYDGGADITGYRLLWCRVLDGADENPCLVTESNSPDDPPGYSRISLGASKRSYYHSVSPGYFYYHLLRATNGGNRWSEWQEHDIAYGRTYAGVPAAPGLTARAVDSSQIKLTWTRPNSYGSEISEFWLYIYEYGDKLYDWDNILDVVRVPGDRAEWTIEGLSPGTTRYFRVRALNDNGEGKYSVLRQATTLGN